MPVVKFEISQCEYDNLIFDFVSIIERNKNIFENKQVDFEDYLYSLLSIGFKYMYSLSIGDMIIIKELENRYENEYKN